jgi:D-threo-aldose 1-dehydrogenase
LIAGEYSLLGTPAAVTLFPACRERGVTVLAAGVYKSGVLAAPHEGAHLDYAPASAAVLARVRAIESVCTRWGVPLPAVALQFVAAHPAVGALVVGAATADEATRNVSYLSLEIPEGLFEELAHRGLLPAEC